MVHRVVTLSALCVTSSLLLTIALLIKLDDRGPILFKQMRVGKDQRAFQVLKFRTMALGGVTRIGELLRQTGLDELPQLWNILSGEMAFVGPRPLTGKDIIRLGWDQPEALKRLSVLPGVAGAAQLLRVCDAQQALECDLKYAQEKSISGDIKILLRSFLVPFRGKGPFR